MWTQILGFAFLSLATAMAQTIDIATHFPLSAENNWHFTGNGQSNSSAADDFAWVVLNEPRMIHGAPVTQVLTLADDSVDERHFDRHYWELQPGGDLFLHGIWNGTADENFPVQDVLFDEAFRVSGAGVSLETVYTQIIMASNVSMGALPATAQLVLSAEHIDIVPEVRTELGVFTDCLRLGLDVAVKEITPLVGDTLSVDIPLIRAVLHLKPGVGVVRYDNLTLPGMPSTQVLDSAMVAGVQVVADIPKGYHIAGILEALLGFSVPGIEFDVNSDGEIDLMDLVAAVNEENGG